MGFRWCIQLENVLLGKSLTKWFQLCESGWNPLPLLHLRVAIFQEELKVHFGDERPLHNHQWWRDWKPQRQLLRDGWYIEVITLWRVICQRTGIISKHLYPTGIMVMYLALNAKAEVMQSTTLLLSYFWLKSCNDLARNTLKCMVSLTQILQIQINQEG